MRDELAAIPKGLKRVVADSFVLNLRLQVISWRLEPDARNGAVIVLAQLMEFLADTAMETAIRIRVLGDQPPDALEDLIQLSSCRPPAQGEPKDRLSSLIAASVQVAGDFLIMGQIARESGDEATAQYLFTRVKPIEEYAWSLGQFVSGPGALDT